MTPKLTNLINECNRLMNVEQLYDPNDLFERLKTFERTHYSVVRRAIHLAKGNMQNYG